MSDSLAAASDVTACARLPPTSRPVARCATRDVEALLEHACAVGDGPTGAHCIHELTMRGAIGATVTRWLERLWKTASASIPEWLPMRHVSWLPLAYEACAEFEPATRGRTHVYLLLLDYADSARGPYGVYVGISRYRAAQRFDQHKQGIRASGAVLRRGLEPLPGPVHHLQHLARREAEVIEEQLAEALRARGLIVKGGH